MNSTRRNGSRKTLFASVFSVAVAVSAAPMMAKAATPDSAYQLNILYTNEAFDNASGGLQRGGVDMNNLDATLEIDAGKAFGLTGGKLHLEGFYSDANSLDMQKTGAIDTQGSIDTTGPQMWRLYQAYYEQQAGNTNIRFGIYDLETEFSETKPELLFLSKNFSWNTAFDLSGTMSQNGTIGPGNFPYTPLALRVRQTLSDEWSAQFVAADAASDDPNHPANNAVILNAKYGATMIGELDYQPTKYTKLMAGVWGMTTLLPLYGPFAPNVDQHRTWGSEGGYIGGSTRLIQGEGRRGLDAFFTLGLGRSDVTAVDQSLNFGLTYTGPFAARPFDKLGLAFNENHAPRPYLQSLVSAGAHGTFAQEDSLELTYRAHVLNDWVTLQPDVQYIMHPGYLYHDNFVVGLHLELSNLVNF
jgi:porin